MQEGRVFNVHGVVGRIPHIKRRTTYHGLPMFGFILVGLLVLLISTSALAQGCQGACGGQSDEGCWCDAECETFGDCCLNKDEVCAAASCQGSCGGVSPTGCWCDAECVANGDCCPDKAQVCDMITMPDVPDIVYCMDVAMWPQNQRTLEEEVLTLVNQRRAQGADCRTAGNFAPAPALTMNANLRCAARVHSKDMVERNFFDHTNPTGEGVAERLMQAMYNYRAFGENIAAGNGTAAATVEQWMESDRHCSNIMKPDFTEIGIGYFPGGDFGHSWTQVFGTPQEQ